MEEDHARSETLVQEDNPICQDDPRYRPQYTDNSKEVMPELRKDLEVKITDIFIWALTEAAVTKMTKTVRDNDPNRISINRLYSIAEQTTLL